MQSQWLKCCACLHTDRQKDSPQMNRIKRLCQDRPTAARRRRGGAWRIFDQAGGLAHDLQVRPGIW